MKSKSLLSLIAASVFAVALAVAAETKTEAPKATVAKCCAEAEKAGKACTHSCCAEAAKAGKNCAKCGGTGDLAKKEVKK